MYRLLFVLLAVVGSHNISVAQSDYERLKDKVNAIKSPISELRHHIHVRPWKPTFVSTLGDHIMDGYFFENCVDYVLIKNFGDLVKPFKLAERNRLTIVLAYSKQAKTSSNTTQHLRSFLFETYALNDLRVFSTKHDIDAIAIVHLIGDSKMVSFELRQEGENFDWKLVEATSTEGIIEQEELGNARTSVELPGRLKQTDYRAAALSSGCCRTPSRECGVCHRPC